jgi:hypothetical protein
MADEDSSSGEGVANRFDSDFDDEFPDGVPCDCSMISHLIGDWSNSSKDKDKNNNKNKDKDKD